MTTQWWNRHFAVRHTHPGLFGVTLIESWMHGLLGIAYVYWGYPPKSSCPCPALGAKANQSVVVYHPITQFLSLRDWGILHLILGVAIVVGLYLNWWTRIVRRCLLISLSMYWATTAGVTIGLTQASLSSYGALTFFSVAAMCLSLGTLSLYAYREPPVNSENYDMVAFGMKVVQRGKNFYWEPVTEEELPHRYDRRRSDRG